MISHRYLLSPETNPVSNRAVNIPAQISQFSIQLSTKSSFSSSTSSLAFSPPSLAPTQTSPLSSLSCPPLSQLCSKSSQIILEFDYFGCRRCRDGIFASEISVTSNPSSFHGDEGISILERTVVTTSTTLSVQKVSISRMDQSFVLLSSLSQPLLTSQQRCRFSSTQHHLTHTLMSVGARSISKFSALRAKLLIFYTDFLWSHEWVTSLNGFQLPGSLRILGWRPFILCFYHCYDRYFLTHHPANTTSAVFLVKKNGDSNQILQFVFECEREPVVMSCEADAKER